MVQSYKQTLGSVWYSHIGKRWYSMVQSYKLTLSTICYSHKSKRWVLHVTVT